MGILARVGLDAPQPPRQAWLRTLGRFVVGAFLTAAVVLLLGLPREPAAWSVVALVVVLGETTGQSVAASLSRVQGTIIGVLSGAVVQLLLGGLWLPILVALAVLLCVVVGRLLRVGAGLRLGIALAGFFVFIPGADELSMVGWRLLSTLIGIGIALLVSVLLWPGSSRAKLNEGIAAVLADLRASVAACLVRWDPPEPGPGGATVELPPVPATLTARVTGLRALLAEIRHEPHGEGPDAEAYAAVLDGIAEAVRAADRLARSGAPGPARLARHLRPATASLEERAASLGDAIGAVLVGAAGAGTLGAPIAALADADAEVAAAIEAMRTRNVTPGADAVELLALFAVADSLLVVCDGLRRAALALLPHSKTDLTPADPAA